MPDSGLNILIKGITASEWRWQSGRWGKWQDEELSEIGAWPFL
jgi:hypothetical protein